MLKVGRWRCIIVVTGLSVSLAHGQAGITFIDNDFQAALDLSNSEGKLIFVDGYATWCAPCQLMDEEVFTTEIVGDYFNANFVNLKMDLEKGIGPILAARYNAQILPSYFVITADETLVYSFTGFQQIQDLLKHAEESLSSKRILKAWQNRYEEGDRKPSFLRAYIKELFVNGDERYRGLINEFLQTQDDWMMESNMLFIFQYLEEVDSVLFEHVTDQYDAYESLIGSFELEQTMNFLVHNEMQNRILSSAEQEILYQKAFPHVGLQKLLMINVLRHQSNASLDSMVVEVDQFLARDHHLPTDSSFSFLRYLYDHHATPEQLLLASAWVEDELNGRSVSDIILYSRVLSKTQQIKQALKLLKHSARKARKAKSNKDVMLYKSEIQKKRR